MVKPILHSNIVKKNVKKKKINISSEHLEQSDKPVQAGK